MIELSTNTALLTAKKALSVFNYGPNGSGKTNMIGTAPKPYTIFTEQPAYGLAMRGFPVQGVVVETFAELQQIVAEIVSGKRAQGFDTICLDSLTDISPLVIKDVLLADREPKNQTEWYHIKEKLKRFVITELIKGIIAVAQKHLYVTARATTSEIEINGSKTAVGLPETIGQFAFQVRGLFDLCAYSEQRMEAVKGNNVPVWELFTVNRGLFFAKDMLGIYDSKEPPDFGTLVQKFNTARERVLSGK